MADLTDVREDLRPAAFTGASTAVMGTIGGLAPVLVRALAVAVDPPSAASLLIGDVALVAAIGIGQGAAAAATALARGKGHWTISPKRGFLASLGVGAFNMLMYFTQMAVPATELGWVPDLLILAAAGAVAGWVAVRAPSGAPAKV